MDRASWPRLSTKLAAVIKTKTREASCAIMEGTDVCFAPVLSWQEAIEHAHDQSRQTFVEVGGVMQPNAAQAAREPQAPCKGPLRGRALTTIRFLPTGRSRRRTSTATFPCRFRS